MDDLSFLRPWELRLVVDLLSRPPPYPITIARVRASTEKDLLVEILSATCDFDGSGLLLLDDLVLRIMMVKSWQARMALFAWWSMTSPRTLALDIKYCSPLNTADGPGSRCNDVLEALPTGLY